jgi:tetratricopeptide (TPR) repeat protein
MRFKPENAVAHNNWGNVLFRLGRTPEAIEEYQQALRIKPGLASAHSNLSFAFAAIGRFREAVEHGSLAARLMPDQPEVNRYIAWLLATHGPINGKTSGQAVQFAERACVLTTRRNSNCLDTLAAAYAAAGRFEEALATGTAAYRMAEAAGQMQLAQDIQKRLELYRDRKPYHESTSAPGDRGRSE